VFPTRKMHSLTACARHFERSAGRTMPVTD
jgi:hypothetical protein